MFFLLLIVRHVLIFFSQDRGDGPLLKVEDRLRNVLVPQYQHFFTQISRQEKGVKFLVDVRADLLVRKNFFSL